MKGTPHASHPTTPGDGPVVVWTLDRDLRFTRSMGGGLAALGLQPDQVVGLTLYQYFQTEDPEFPPISAALRALDGEASTLEVEWGGRLYDTYVQPQRTSDGSIDGVLGMAVDVTERRESERRLCESEERYRRLIELLPDAIVVHVKGRIRFANQAAAEMLGVDAAAELVSRDVMDFVTSGERRLVEERIRNIEEGVALARPRLGKVKRADGQVRDVETFTCAVALDGERGVMVVARDQTERLALEEQLRHAQKMEAVARLAGGVAHDFNNLLTVILGCCSLLERDLPAADARLRRVREISETAQRAAHLTRQLLALKRRQTRYPVVFDLGAQVLRTLPMLRGMVGEDIELDVEKVRPGTFVRADRAEFEQVLLNIAVNAREAMPDGGRLRLRTGREQVESAPTGSGAGRYAVLTIEDSGVGMDEQTRERIFEPYFTTKPDGTGLGLSTVYGIVQDCGGFLRVRSEPGKGTSMAVLLPEAREPAPEPVREEEPAPRARPGGTETVLVVEDEESVRALAVEVLRQAGYAVLEARDGREALALARARAQRIHALVTDVVMPAMNGAELAERLRAERPGLRVIYMSGYANGIVDRLGRGLDEKEGNFLHKPFRPGDLLRLLRKLLDS